MKEITIGLTSADILMDLSKQGSSPCELNGRYDPCATVICSQQTSRTHFRMQRLHAGQLVTEWAGWRTICSRSDHSTRSIHPRPVYVVIQTNAVHAIGCLPSILVD